MTDPNIMSTGAAITIVMAVLSVALLSVAALALIDVSRRTASRRLERREEAAAGTRDESAEVA